MFDNFVYDKTYKIYKQKDIMNKIFYLASCDTCRKIIKALPIGHDLIFHDIKQNPLTEQDLQEMYLISGNYEFLFSKKAQLYKLMGLKDKNLTELDFKKYLLEHYTFLSRPVFIIKNEIYVGNTQQSMLKVHKAFENV